MDGGASVMAEMMPGVVPLRHLTLAIQNPYGINLHLGGFPTARLETTYLKKERMNLGIFPSDFISECMLAADCFDHLMRPF